MNVVRIVVWNVFGDKFLLFINLLRSNKADTPSAITIYCLISISYCWQQSQLCHKNMGVFLYHP